MADCEPNAPRFMDLTVPEYACMFGFLQADGHLQQGVGQKGRLTVEISARDIHLLREFQKLTPYYSSITERTRSTNFTETHTSATWSMCSLDARTTLNELGLPYGRKSKTIAPPRGAFSHRDYLRGVVDADGSVGYSGQGYPFLSLTTASTSIGAYVCQYVQEVTGTERNIKRNVRDGIYNICYWKEQAQELAAHLYYPGCLSLQRKQAAAQSLSAWVRPVGMKVMSHRRWQAWEDRVLLEHNDADSAAEALDRTVQSCALRLWRFRTGKVPMPTGDQ